MNMDVTVTARGPVFDRARPILERGVGNMQERVADTGVMMVQRRLDTVLKHPTGKYRRSIRATRSSVGADVTDSGVVYGPWLEGVSRRNQATRFKGYATFRRVTQELQASVDRVVAPDVNQLAKDLS
jgi:hypothetical protein